MSIVKSYSNKPVLRDSRYPSIFLAGPTKRNGITQWRIDACKILNEEGFGGIVYIPEYDGESFDNSRITEQCIWEREAMQNADCILFWIPRYLGEGMPAFTTNVEFGTFLQMKPEQIVYGRPDEAEKMRYLDWLYQYEKGPEFPIHNDLKETVISAKNTAEWILTIREIA